MKNITSAELLEKYGSGERDFSNLNISGINLSSVVIRDAIFRQCDFSNANLSNSDFTDCDFSNSMMSRCILDKSILKNVNFLGCDLTGASLRDILVDNTSFRNSKLMFAHLCGNDMLKCDLNNAVLEWSCLIGTSLDERVLDKIPKTAITGGIDNISTYSSESRKGGYGVSTEPSGYGKESEPSTSVYGSESEIRNRRTIQSYSENEEKLESGYNKEEQPKDLKKDLRRNILDFLK